MARINDIVISDMAFNNMVRKLHNKINQPATRLRELYKHSFVSDEIIAKNRKQARINKKLEQERLKAEILEKQKIKDAKRLEKQYTNVHNWIQNDIVDYLYEDEENQLLLKYDNTYKIKNFDSPTDDNLFSWSIITKEQKKANYQYVLYSYIKKYSNKYSPVENIWGVLELEPSIIYIKEKDVIRCLLYNNFDFVKELNPFEF